jgi:hypothetical protein
MGLVATYRMAKAEEFASQPQGEIAEMPGADSLADPEGQCSRR